MRHNYITEMELRSNKNGQAFVQTRTSLRQQNVNICDANRVRIMKSKLVESIDCFSDSTRERILMGNPIPKSVSPQRAYVDKLWGINVGSVCFVFLYASFECSHAIFLQLIEGVTSELCLDSLKRKNKYEKYPNTLRVKQTRMIQTLTTFLQKTMNRVMIQNRVQRKSPDPEKRMYVSEKECTDTVKKMQTQNLNILSTNITFKRICNHQNIMWMCYICWKFVHILCLLFLTVEFDFVTNCSNWK